MSDETYAVHLADGRVETFETVTVLDRGESDWIRCQRPGPSSREKLPETTKYYNREEIVRIERIDGNGASRPVGIDQLDFARALKKTLPTSHD